MAVITLSLLFTATMAGAVTRSCPSVPALKKLSYQYWMRGDDGSYVFASKPVGKAGLIFVKKYDSQQEAAQAAKKALMNLSPKTVPALLMGHCLYQGKGVRKDGKWVASYPTIGFW